MRSSVLIVIFDFFVCSLLLTVSVGSGPSRGREMTPRDGAAVSEASTTIEFSEGSINAEFNDKLAEYERIEEEIAHSTQPGISEEEAKKMQVALDEGSGKIAELQGDLAQAEEERRKAEAAAIASANAAEEAIRNAAASAEERRKSDETATAAKRDAAKAQAVSAEEKRKADEDAMASAKEAKEAKEAATAAAIEVVGAKRMNEELQKRLSDADAAANQAQKEREDLQARIAKLEEEKKRTSLPEPLPAKTPGMPGPGMGGDGNQPGPGGVDGLVASRVEVMVAITEDGSFPRLWDVEFTRTINPVAFNIGEKTYILAKAEDFSFGWDGWSERDPADVSRFDFFLSKRGMDTKSSSYTGGLRPLSENPNLVLAQITDKQLLSALSPLQPVDPLKLGEKLISDGIIYKTSGEGGPMAVRFQRDLQDPNRVRLIYDVVTPRAEADTTMPALGDYLVTQELRLVAIMINENQGLVVGQHLADSIGEEIPLNDRTKFLEGEQRWAEEREK